MEENIENKSCDILGNRKYVNYLVKISKRRKENQ